jgi:hypothetical protein
MKSCPVCKDKTILYNTKDLDKHLLDGSHPIGEVFLWSITPQEKGNE